MQKMHGDKYCVLLHEYFHLISVKNTNQTETRNKK